MRRTVPAGVLAQAWRAGPQPNLSRLLRGCRVEDLTEGRARACGAALARSGSSDIVDASVVMGGASRADLVVTGDSSAPRALADALRIDLDLATI